MGKKAGRPPFLPRPPACLNIFSEETLNISDGNKEVEEEAKSIQNRLRAMLIQVWDENAIFQRIMYKNRNQHRRTVYFRRLMQVRRDLLLLQSFGLKDVVETLPHCVSFSKKKALPSKAVLGSLWQGLESKDQLILTVQRRLLGAARLLQMMAEPILSASSLIAGLLSQSFFMPFALTVMAMLARFRVLLVQVLYELITAFNLVSALVQKMEISSVPADVPLFLECSWDGLKIEFLEKMPLLQPTPPSQELTPLPTSLLNPTRLPDVGWFVDDRSSLAKEKPQSTGVLELVLHERDERFILEDSPFALLGEEEITETPVLYERDESIILENSPFEVMGEVVTETPGITMEAIPTPSSVISNMEAEVSSGTQEMARASSIDERAELESWKAELGSWGKKEVDKLVEEPNLDGNTKKRVAYVSVQIGGVKESKIKKTEHQM